MAGKKKNFIRVVLNLPPRTAATLEYLIQIAQVSRTKSDLIVQLLNEYIDKRRDSLNDQQSWKEFVSMFDNQKKEKVQELVSKFLSGKVLEDDSDDLDDSEEE